jgi:hypothetical protein
VIPFLKISKESIIVGNFLDVYSIINIHGTNGDVKFKKQYVTCNDKNQCVRGIKRIGLLLLKVMLFLEIINGATK